MNRNGLNWLGDRRPPLFGVVTLAVLLLVAAADTAYFVAHWQVCPGARQAPVTLLSWLPESLLESEWLIWSAAACFTVGALPWLGQLLIPWSGWLATGGFLAVCSLYIENANQLTHVAHLPAVVLALHALWYQCYAGEIKNALADGIFWTAPVYPRWVHFLSLYAIALFYGFAGWTKLYTSGLGWANGVSMQLWVSVWGDPNSVATRLILEHRSVARLLQWLALIAECGAPLALFFPRVRIFWGLLLIGFHIGQIVVFSWGFHGNALLIGLFFFPWDKIGAKGRSATGPLSGANQLRRIADGRG